MTEHCVCHLQEITTSNANIILIVEQHNRRRMKSFDFSTKKNIYNSIRSKILLTIFFVFWENNFWIEDYNC